MKHFFKNFLFLTLLGAIIMPTVVLAQATPPAPIDILTLGTQRGTGGSITVDDVYQSDKQKYTTFRTACVAANGAPEVNLDNSLTRCPNQPAGAAPTCQLAHARCTVTVQPTTTSGAATAAPSGSYEFTPLTNLPGLTQGATADSLPAFFNNLYKLCIGAAAVIAIIQIMRAGMYFMFNKGSVAHNEKAKSFISNAILGLLLVLSPYIVFTLINPDILDLRLNLGGLAPDTDPNATFTIIVLKTATDPLDASEVPDASQLQRAQEFGRTCIAGGGTPRVNVSSVAIHCPADTNAETRNCANAQVRCEHQTALGSVMTTTACQTQYMDITTRNAGQQCDTAKGETSIPSSCCSPGTVCCGKSRFDVGAAPPDPANMNRPLSILYIREQTERRFETAEGEGPGNRYAKCRTGYTATYNTLQECQTVLVATRQQERCSDGTICEAAVKHNCNATRVESYLPSSITFTAIVGLPVCQNP